MPRFHSRTAALGLRRTAYMGFPEPFVPLHGPRRGRGGVELCNTRIRPYAPQHRAAVRDLFVSVNREIAPSRLTDVFETYVASSLANEIDRIDVYYLKRGGSFWIAEHDGLLAGMFGVERVAPGVAELRRMYVAPEARGRGLGSCLLGCAEAWSRSAGHHTLRASTSELQMAALSLYLSMGYRLVCQERAQRMTVKAVGADLRRFHLEKSLQDPAG